MDVYSCEVCGNTLDPSHKGTLRLSLVWMRGSGATAAKIEEKFHRYRHEVCIGYADETQLPLF